MKYYKDLAEKGVFNSHYIISIAKGKNNADQIIRNYQKAGLIKKIKHNLYATISLENGGLIPSKYHIACAINSSSFISHHSAFEFYGFYNQVYNSINVSSLHRFHPFDFEGTEYQYFQSHSEKQVNLVRGVKITSIERTIVDSINDVDKVAGIEELLKCISLVPYLEEQLILDYLKHRSSKLLYIKTGYLLSHFKEEFNLSEEFFTTCLLEGGKVIGYFSQIDKSNLVYNSKWHLYAYDNLLKFIQEKDSINV